MLPEFTRRTAYALIAVRTLLVIWRLASSSSGVVVVHVLSVFLNIMAVCLGVYTGVCGRILVAVTLYARDNSLVVHSCGISGKVRTSLSVLTVTTRHLEASFKRMI